MKRILIPFALVAAVALATGSIALAGSHQTKLKLRKTSLGKLLVAGSGFTVYEFAKDGHNQDNCQAISGCLSIWPPVTTPASVVAGPGVKKGKIGTIKLANGSEQVTYAGHPLYRYTGDTHRGQTSYVGVNQFGGRWYGLRASGKKVK